jgi:predicted MFS family arabinose efflux permease
MKNLFLIFTSRRYFAAAQLFLCLSLMFGTWVIYIPTITDKLEITKGELGFALLFSAIGALLSLPFGKMLVSKLGEGRLALIATILNALAMTGNFLAGSLLMLSISLFFVGFCGGFLQIGINSVVSSIEKDDDVSIMSSCHGFFSLGGILASGLGTMIMILIDNPLLHIFLMFSTVVILQVVFAKAYLKLNKEFKHDFKPGKFSASGLKNPLLLGLAVVAVSVMVSEGAIADWSALYLRDVALSGEDLVGLGYAGFSVTMTLGRFMGDFFSRKFGAWQIIVSGLSFSIIGLLLVLTAIPLVTITGFIFIGFGFSVIVPEVYRQSSNIKGVEPSTGIAFMAGAGYFGFLAGPVSMGAIAEKSGLRASFVALSVLILLGTLTAFVLKNVQKKKNIAAS